MNRNSDREKNQISEKIFPVCLDNKPNKYSKIGKIVDSNNELIKALLSTETSKKISLIPGECTDFYHYNERNLQQFWHELSFRRR